MVVRKIRITGIIMILLSAICAYKALSVLVEGAHFGSHVEIVCRGISTEGESSRSSEMRRLAESCGTLRAQIHTLQDVQSDAFLWLFAVAFVLFAWGSALIIWSRTVARAAA